MYKIILIVCGLFCMLCSPCSLGEEKISFSGKIINEQSGDRISGLKVSLGTYRKTWKFWAMPEFEVLSVSVTDKDGVFYLSGPKEKYFVVTLDEDVCWKPFSKTFSKDEFGMLNGFVIETFRSNAKYCN